MKCPKCVELGLKSTLNGGGYGMSTDMCVEQYYDEDGKLHVHDPNCSTSSWRCSNGHHISVSRYGRCGRCDFGKGETKVWYYPEGAKQGEPLDPKLLGL